MSIKITDKLLSIPPYLSTQWSQVGALHMKGSILVVTLVDGDTLQIPNLDSEIVQLIFHYHASYLEKEPFLQNPAPFKKEGQNEGSIQFAFGTSSSVEGLGNMMQHNPSQSDAPDLPPEVLDKIGAITKILSPTHDVSLPQAEVGCNCFYCQIARAISPQEALSSSQLEEIKEEDLHFEDWMITQTGDQLFSVVNRLDDHEKYHVFLGEPLGCTCGKERCEHILAVLRS